VFLENITSFDYDIKESHEYALSLPESYYGPGSYQKWIKVGWALKNIDNRLVITWIAFSAQSKEFKFADVPELCEKWSKMDMRKLSGGVTKRSLMHWVKQDAHPRYLAIRENSIDYYIERTISGTSITGGSEKSNKGECGDWDLAKVLHVLYKDQFVCSSIKSNVWYNYVNNRWVEDETGSTLRKMISTEMRELYNNKTIGQLNGMMTTITPPNLSAANEEEQTNIRKIRSQRILNICQRLNRTSDKKNIMTEARDLFYDSNFLNKLDTNPYLLCFNNIVIDFKEKVARKGRPDDYISKCTGIDYVAYDRVKNDPAVGEIEGFFRQLFPDPQLYNYMFDYLASTLIGTTSNQTFNMFIGGGSNGKSKLIDLMKLVLGDYKGEVPLSLVTGERTRIGGLSPEIVQLKGVRFAVMQEPEKGVKLNEGKMKELTGGDSIQARAPYMLQAVTFIPQFKLAVCSNTMMEIGSNDHGTWRRICVVPFESLFTEDPVDNDPGKPYQFKIDKNIQEKFEDWKETLASMLVRHAFKTDGIVKLCARVSGASDEYRQNQDFIAEFIRDKVLRLQGGKIRKKEITTEFNNWYRDTYGNGRGCPNPKDIHEYMDKQFGRQRNQVWENVKIKYDREDFTVISSDLSSIGDDITANDL
jgi:P4 family phage/plasmid primase-like protien